jgi:hypothetical protein
VVRRWHEAAVACRLHAAVSPASPRKCPTCRRRWRALIVCAHSHRPQFGGGGGGGFNEEGTWLHMNVNGDMAMDVLDKRPVGSYLFRPRLVVHVRV